MNISCFDESLSFVISIVLSLWFASSGLAAVIGNAVVLWLFYKNETLRTVSNRFLASLCVADFLAGLLTDRVWMIIRCLIQPPRTATVLIMVLDMLWIHTTAATVFNLCCVSVDRFIAMGVARIFQWGGHTDSYIGYSPNCNLSIVGCLLTKRLTKGGSRAPQDPPLATPLIAIRFPFRYQDIITKKRCYAVIIMVWLIALLLPFPVIFEDVENLWSFLTVLMVCIPIALITLCYFCIYKAARKQTAAIRRVTQTGAEPTLAVKQYKAIKTIGFVLGVFLASWMPYFVVSVVHYLVASDSCMNYKLYAVLLTQSLSHHPRSTLGFTASVTGGFVKLCAATFLGCSQWKLLQNVVLIHTGTRDCEIGWCH